MSLPEQDIMKILDKYVDINDVCVDVGANVGSYTGFFLNKLGGTGKVYSIELHPKTFGDLENQFGQIPNLILMNCAVSDTDGVINYYRGRDISTNNIIGHDMDFRANELEGTIQSWTLDTILKGEGKIKFIKIDVEGADTLVLRGMTEVFNRTDYIFLECHLDKDWDDIKEILFDKNDFEVMHLDGTDRLVERNDPRAYLILCKNKKTVK